MSFNYKTRIEYQGTHYCGWQIQPSEPSIQNTLNDALARLCGSANMSEIKTLASSRTDSGVHALDQVVRITLPKYFAPEKLKQALNAILPADIRILELLDADDSFHPLRFIEKKEYFYLFQQENKSSVFTRPYVHSYRGELDLHKMKAAALEFLGTHDFAYYQSTGTVVKTTVRTIYAAEVTATLSNPFLMWQNADGIILFSVTGNGFLRQMVRAMAGVLLGAGKGEITIEQIRKTFATPHVLGKKKLAPVLPANSLFLHSSWPKF